jgi:hypothetical protein
MAESYDELKKENEKLKQEREKDRKIVHALKDQVDKLKLIIKARSMDGNIDYREKEIEYLEMAKENQEMRSVIREKDQIIDSMRAELAESLRAKAEIIDKKKTMQQDEAKAQQLNYYRNLSIQQMKESSQLAEELICLRSDID